MIVINILNIIVEVNRMTSGMKGLSYWAAICATIEAHKVMLNCKIKQKIKMLNPSRVKSLYSPWQFRSMRSIIIKLN